RSLEILRFFEAVTISSEAGYAKPHPEIFRTALRMLQVQGSRALLVGDSLEDDVEAAKLVGIHSVLLDRSGRHPEFDSAPKIQNLRQVFDYIRLDPAGSSA